MSVKANSNTLASWKWPLAFVVAVAAVILLSGRAGTATGPGGVPVLKNGDEYAATLSKANAIFATEIGKYDAKQPLDAEDLKQLRDAALMYDELNLFNPTRMGPYFASGRVHLALGDTQVALEQFRQAIDNSDKEGAGAAKEVKQLAADSRWYIAICFENINDFAAALPPVSDAIKAYPDRPDYRYTRARALIQLKRLPDAINDLKLALKLKPDYPEAKSLLRFLGSS